MSIQRLQEKIRKTKNPSILDFGINVNQLPPHLLRSEGSFPKAYARFCIELMDGLHGLIPAVKFNFSQFALLGTEGTLALLRVLEHAKGLGYYKILEIPEALSREQAVYQADMLFGERSLWPFDGVLLSSYIGSDGIEPYALRAEETGKSLFVIVRTANRSAPQLQDLLSGGRNVYDAKADIVNRLQNAKAGRYEGIALVGPASAPAVLQKLRRKYKKLFIMADGFDYSNANAKNCAQAADELGHGVAVCAGSSITAAWQTAENDGTQYVADAMEAAQRMKKNLERYFTVL